MINNKRSGIYKIYCSVNQKVYIGSAINIEKRWKKHIRELKSKIHHNSHLQAAWIKYGPGCFKFYVLLYCPPEDCIRFEQNFIGIYQAANDKYGFNICLIAGSPLGIKRSQETRQKISEINKGKNSTRKLALKCQNQEKENVVPKKLARKCLTHKKAEL